MSAKGAFHAVPGICGLAVLILSGCQKSESPTRFQGYIEGEFVYVASPLGGKLETLSVSRGDMVEANAPLFALDNIPETAARDEAQNRLVQAQATLEDVRKGKRPSEIDSLAAQLQQARETLALSEKEAIRQEKLATVPGAGTQKDLDAARSTRDQNRQKVAQLEADLKTAQLGSRADQISAVEAEAKALAFTLKKTEWNLEQKRQSAPVKALVYDTFYRVGEWVPDGRAVVSLLPPGNVKIRVYVPQEQMSRLHPGGTLRVYVDGIAAPYSAKISYISTREEYTPPVIYSKENRAKLVFLVEGRFDSDVALKLHPGQPVDVEWQE